MKWWIINWIQHNRKRYLAVSLSIIIIFSLLQFKPLVSYAASSDEYTFTKFKFSDGGGNTILDGDIIISYGISES